MKPVTEGHVVESYKIGNTRVKICDDYCAKTPEQVQKILDRIGNIVFEQMCADASLSDKNTEAITT